MKPPTRSDVLESYGELKDVQTALFEGFGELRESDVADPKYVVDVYLKLAETGADKRPMRTQVWVTWGADAINKLTQPIQDNVQKEMQLETVLGGASFGMSDVLKLAAWTNSNCKVSPESTLSGVSCAGYRALNSLFKIHKIRLKWFLARPSRSDTG